MREIKDTRQMCKEEMYLSFTWTKTMTFSEIFTYLFYH